MLDVNVMSGVRLSRYYLPRLLAANWGRIVFLSSESALQIPAEMIHYGVSKTALLGVSRGLAELTAGTGVTVNAVLPGPTRSEGVASFFAELAQAQGVPQAQMERDFIAQNRPSSLLPAGHGGGSGQHGGVRLLDSGLGHQRRGAARGRRRGPLDRLNPPTHHPES